jgi:2-polyprenyl-3-methyl-5-hydroxy-6-metoxy-1,4-benzoquinol methylase
MGRKNKSTVAYCLLDRGSAIMKSLVAEFLRRKTLESFDYQWQNLPTGIALLSDPWFRENVARILSEEELCVDPDWFRGKEVLDAGCGNGRWTYGLLRLGANVTALDASQAACTAVRRTFPKEQRLTVIQANLLRLPDEITERQFDLVFCWGVLHHTGNAEQALKELAALVKPDGLVYLYLYGKESLRAWSSAVLEIERLLLLPFSSNAKKRILSFLYPSQALHSTFDLLATPINDRFDESTVRRWFSKAGFDRTIRTMHHTELFMKAWRSGALVERFFTNPKEPPYWFQKLNQQDQAARLSS